MPRASPLSARLAVLGAALLFSSGGVAIKATSLAGIQVACLRSAVAGVALFVLVKASRPPWSWRIAGVGLAQATTLILFVLANKLTTAANAIFLQSTAPLYVVLLGPLILGERLARRDLATVGLSALGLSLFFFDQQAPLSTASNPPLGNVLAVASGLTWALTIIGFRRLGASATPSAGVQAVVLGNVTAAIATLPFALPLPTLAVKDIVVILALGLVQVALAYVLLSYGMRKVRAIEGAILLLAEPALNPLWAWLVHEEAPGAFALGGGSLVLGATLLSAWLDARAERASEKVARDPKGQYNP